MSVTDELLRDLKAHVAAKEITDPDGLLEALKSDMKAQLAGLDRELHLEPGPEGSPNVWLFVGVNGVGKTTSIGKVGAQQVAEGRRVVLGAGDTFRAAAAEQLGTWAERAGADFVRGSEGGDPSSVIFDAVQRASARGYDLVLADTAGRLHTKTNLMEELRKVRRVADREPGRVTEVLLVIDATTGQNGLVQAHQFTEATDVTGVVLTKLDGSAKGGIVFAVQTELGIPVKLVGLGEGIADMVPFDPDEFVDALFDDSSPPAASSHSLLASASLDVVFVAIRRFLRLRRFTSWHRRRRGSATGQPDAPSLERAGWPVRQFGRTGCGRRSLAGTVAVQFGDQLLGRDGPVALLDPVAEDVDGCLVAGREAGADPARPAEAVPRRLGEGHAQRRLAGVGQLDRQAHAPVLRWHAHEHEDLLADLGHAIAPRMVLPGTGQVEGETAQAFGRAPVAAPAAHTAPP